MISKSELCYRISHLEIVHLYSWRLYRGNVAKRRRPVSRGLTRNSEDVVEELSTYNSATLSTGALQDFLPLLRQLHYLAAVILGFSWILVLSLHRSGKLSRSRPAE